MTLGKDMEILTIWQAEKTCLETLIKQSSSTTNQAHIFKGRDFFGRFWGDWNLEEP